jgi:starvation-inducible outer membrane lipoprotein
MEVNMTHKLLIATLALLSLAGCVVVPAEPEHHHVRPDREWRDHHWRDHDRWYRDDGGSWRR